jgi:DNA-binding NarL/FixJ family response regulator
MSLKNIGPGGTPGRHQKGPAGSTLHLAGLGRNFRTPSGLHASCRVASGSCAREREVLQLIAEGRSAKEIAHILGIAVKTTSFHRENISESSALKQR